MSSQVQEIVEMLEMLPDVEKDLAVELLKRIVLAWDPEYIKLTKKEAEKLEEAEEGDFIDSEEIDWSDLGKYL